jgi:hypothetical protein
MNGALNTVLNIGFGSALNNVDDIALNMALITVRNKIPTRILTACAAI